MLSSVVSDTATTEMNGRMFWFTSPSTAVNISATKSKPTVPQLNWNAMTKVLREHTVLR
jgi:hypothetical protein